MKNVSNYLDRFSIKGLFLFGRRFGSVYLEVLFGMFIGGWIFFRTASEGCFDFH